MIVTVHFLSHCLVSHVLLSKVCKSTNNQHRGTSIGLWLNFGLGYALLGLGNKKQWELNWPDKLYELN